MPQPVGWDLGAEGDPGVPGGEGLCVGAQGWQPCPRPLTQHRHRRCRAGNSRCRQRAGSCQARLPDPGRLRGQTAALPCSPWGRAGQMCSTALAGAMALLLVAMPGVGLAVAVWLSLGKAGRIAGETELLGCHPSCLPAMASARAEHSQHRPFFQGSDRKDSLQCLYPPTSDVLGGALTHRPRAQGTRAHKRKDGTTAPLGPCRVGALMPAGLHSLRNAPCPPPACSHPPCTPWPAGNQCGGDNPSHPSACTLLPPGSTQPGVAALQGHSSMCPPAPCPLHCSRGGDEGGDGFGKPAWRERHKG